MDKKLCDGVEGGFSAENHSVSFHPAVERAAAPRRLIGGKGVFL